MTILPTLPEILQLLFGLGWCQRAPAALGRSRRQIARWCSGETRIPRRVLVLLSQSACSVVEEIERWRQDEQRRVEKDAHARKSDALQAGMWLRGMLFDRPEWEPPPKVGRPRKHVLQRRDSMLSLRVGRPRWFTQG
jgi:hypothetical protein